MEVPTREELRQLKVVELRQRLSKFGKSQSGQLEQFVGLIELLDLACARAWSAFHIAMTRAYRFGYYRRQGGPDHATHRHSARGERVVSCLFVGEH